MRFQVQKILLVDDDPDDCFLFRKALSEISPDLQLQFLSDVDELMAAVSSNRPDIVFMDINMPKINGFDCVRQIREHSPSPQLPIVMYSCSEQDSFIQKGYLNGAQLYLCKQASYQGLLLSLKKILALDWANPEKIVADHFLKGHYLPFEVA